ncbi:phenylacetate-CoA oxygenase subunit PaaJ [Paenalcaligenes niemegkensis]|uniref:1,2-phenylacetyl-CoA epoxidase subunit PaaD n=1 Tax=Paenalcaligenes niemegkensis TaxID=2895469 RepID=UPI001EE94906|nr:1,2-phenylacetyl-CoA epoxidase subunit PaaD [Paenalcaligenes niemegkensis]MCQ9616776.1 phenylacetate-CoA oxygenase subunit PaaJ [Paenalcaligenes niemegkensis]
MTSLPFLSEAELLELLEQVPDPEIPVVSVVDLGIVRAICWEEGVCVVSITPTYSGCPAMYEIERDIKLALQKAGLERVRVETVLSPAWTTDWMSEKARKALGEYGIAPPQHQAVDISALLHRHDEPAVPCPQCGSSLTRMISYFGSTPCKALYSCSQCSEPFDYFKAH